MAKHLVEAGTQDIPVGTPIFVTVEDADSVAAFKDFEAEPVAEEGGEAEAAPPAPEPAAPEPVVEEEVAAAAAPAPTPATAPAPPAPAAPVVEAPKEAAPSPAGATVGLVFKRDWGSGVEGSPLAHRCVMFRADGCIIVPIWTLCRKLKAVFGVGRLSIGWRPRE